MTPEKINQIKSIQSEIDSLKEQIRPLADKVCDLRQQMLNLKSPFKVGDIITWNDEKAKGTVVEIREWACGDPMWLVRRILKDGTDSTVFTTVRNWSHPKIVRQHDA